jgi:hypothetical protein
VFRVTHRFSKDPWPVTSSGSLRSYFVTGKKQVIHSDKKKRFTNMGVTQAYVNLEMRDAVASGIT